MCLCSPPVCLKGTKIPGNVKYFLVDTVKKRYHTANEDCIAKGGILSTPLSSYENMHYDYVRQSIGPAAEMMLGINDMQTEGVWRDQWLDENCREETSAVSQFKDRILRRTGPSKDAPSLALAEFPDCASRCSRLKGHMINFSFLFGVLQALGA
uniref:C-type lectin domain-containing protein n=1 Tax=Sinocyclocheilus anshuiensis TaxID=1608454 RepID=A0A671P9C4_9TELE